MQTRYLNTDLDLFATVDLTPLAAVFESQGVFPLHVTRGEDGHWSAILETDGQYEEPESSIAAMLSVIEQFDEPERSIWRVLTLCEFNIGYDCGSEPWAFNQGLSNALLQRMAKVGASLRVTLYSPESLQEKSQQTQLPES
ncbi:hypothetical protein V2H45_24830 [Tumidithrix elongata RA019]|uniref:DUF4279 domain-containing protein n=1 Tax=Tumidithrix elongata BACA0141 TaxID=2716417 RepID=A0AAW9Q494_9CYAN|nr:hypothetical protein [Tumidithrix elongata RA019]